MAREIYRMERDRARFKSRARPDPPDLRRYLSSSELIGKQGDQVVSIPVPTSSSRASASGPRREGRRPGRRARESRSRARPARKATAAKPASRPASTFSRRRSSSRSSPMLGEELELPLIEPRGPGRDSWSRAAAGAGSRSQGPQSLKHFRRTYRRRWRGRSRRVPSTPRDPRVTPIRDDERFRTRRPAPNPSPRPSSST